MHVDFFVAPPAPSPYRAPAGKKTERQSSFVYTGDQFLFSGEPASHLRPYKPPVTQEPQAGFWTWFQQLFS